MVLGAGSSNGKMVLKKKPLEMISKKVCCLAISIICTNAIIHKYIHPCIIFPDVHAKKT